MYIYICIYIYAYIYWKVWGVRPKWGEKTTFKNMRKHGKLGKIMEDNEKYDNMTRDIKTWQFENLTVCENCGSNFSVSALGWYPARVCNVKGSGSYKACGQIHHMWFSKENQDSSGLLFLEGQNIFKWMGLKWQGLTEGKAGQGPAHQTSSNK